MSRKTRNLILLLFPFISIILINEVFRLRLSNEEPYHLNGQKTINSAKWERNLCTWQCHHNSQFCKSNHVKLLNNYFHYSDPLYFGVIKGMKTTGNYFLANVLFFVFLFPIAIYYLLIRSFDFHQQIKALKQHQNGNPTTLD